MAASFGLLSAGSAAAQTTGDWNVNADGNWSDPSRWVGGVVPNGVGHVADIVQGISTTRTITLDVPVTLGTLRLGDDNGSSAFVLTGGANANTLTFDNGGSGAILDHSVGAVTGGPNKSPNSGDRLDMGVILNDNLTIHADRNLEMRGLWSATSNQDIVFDGTARLYFNPGTGASITGVDTISIADGELRFDDSGNVVGANTINVGDGLAGSSTLYFARLYLVNTDDTQTANINLNGGWLINDLGLVDQSFTGNISLTGAAGTNIIDVNDAGTPEVTTFTGVISGSGGFTKLNNGAMVLTNRNTFDGEMQIERGRTSNLGSVHLSGADGAVAGTSRIVISRDGSLYLDNSGPVNLDRVNDSADVTLRDLARMRLVGNATLAVSEKAGDLRVEAGTGRVTFDLNVTDPQPATMTFDSFGRSAGAVAQFHVIDNLRGTLGTVAQLHFLDGGASADQAGGGGANGTTNRTLVIGAFGGGNDVANHFMTFDGTSPTLLRPLDFNTEYLLSSNLMDNGVTHRLNRNTIQGSDQNVMINYNVLRASNPDPQVDWYGPRPVQVTESIAINSLRFGTNTPNDPSNSNNTNDIGSVLVLNPNTVIYLGDKAAGDGLPAVTTSGSGMILFGRDIDGTSPDSTQYIVGGALDFGSREAIMVNESGASALIRSEIRGTGGLTKAGAQTVYLDGANSYSGTTNIAEGILDLRHSQGLGGSTVVQTKGNGSLYLELGVDVADTIDLQISGLAVSQTVLRSNSGNNTWNGDIIVDNVSELGQLIYTPYINVSTGDTLNLNGTIYGASLSNPLAQDNNLTDSRIISTESSSSGVININGSFQDTAAGAVGSIGGTSENDLLRFQVTGHDQLVVNVRNQWSAAGRIYMEQGHLRYEGDGNFWSDAAAASMVETNGLSGMRFSGSSSGDTDNIHFVLTKDGQKLNIDRFDIGGNGSSDNYNDRGNIVLAGTNTSGTVTFGNGTSVIVYGASDATRSHTRDLAAFAMGGGTVNMDFRLDDSDTDVHTSFTKIGGGIVNMRGDNTTSSGDVEQLNLAGGLLRLTNYGTSTGSRFDSGAMLVFAGGGLELDGVGSIANETENFTGTAVGGAITFPAGSAQTIIGSGSSNVVVTSDAGRTTTLNIGSAGIALDRQSGGTLHFVENGNGGTAVITLIGIGAPAADTAIAWASYGDEFDAASQNAMALDFAMVDAGGAVSQFTGSTRQDADDVTTWTAAADVSEGAAGFSGTTAAGTAVNTLHFDFDGSSSLTVDAGGLTVTAGGLLVSSAVVNSAATKSIGGGDLMAGSGVDLIVHQYGVGALTIGSNIVDNNGTALVKTGPGELILTGTNTFSGGTHLHGGTLTVRSDAQLGAAPGTVVNTSIRINGGTLHTTADFTLDANRGIEVGGNGGGIAVDDGTALTYGGVISAASNLTAGYDTPHATDRILKSGAGTLVLTGTDNTFTGLLDIAEGTVRWQAAGLGSTTVTVFGTNNEFMDGTIVRSGATLDLAGGTASTSSNSTTTIEEWFRFEAGSTLSTSLISTTANPADRNYNLRGVIHLDALGNAGAAAGAMVMNIGRRAINLNDDGGYLTGDGGIIKIGAGALYFRDSSPEWTGQLIINEGTVGAYSAGAPVGVGSHPILLGHDGSAAGEIGGGNNVAAFYIRNESGFNFLPAIAQDIIVRNENGLGSQTKRLGAIYLNHEDVANFNGALTLNDNVEFYYQDDAREASRTTSGGDVRNDTRGVGAPVNAETMFINFNGDISGAAGISTNVVQGGNGNTANGSITGAMDDLVLNAIFGLNGDNRGWSGSLTISNNAGAASTDDVDRIAIVRLENVNALNDNLVRFGNRGYLQLGGIDKTFTQDFQFIGSTGLATTARIQNASEVATTITFDADAAKIGAVYQDVGVGLEDGLIYGGKLENKGVLNVLKTGAGNTVFGASTGGGEIADAFSSYTGTTTVQQGILYAGSNNALSPYSRFIVNDGAELSLYWDQALTGFDNTIGSLSGSAGALVDIENAILRLGADGSTGADFAGVVSGNGNIYKVGTGSQHLSGANTFIGDVAVIEGALIGGGNAAFGDAFNVVQLGGVPLVTANPIDARVELLLDGSADAVANAVVMNGFDGNDEGITLIGTRAGSGTFGFSETGTIEASRNFFARADGTSTFRFGGEINDFGVGITMTKLGSGTLELQVANSYGPGGLSGLDIDGGTVVRHGTLAVLNSAALGSTVVELGDRRQTLVGGVYLATSGALRTSAQGGFDPNGDGAGNVGAGAWTNVKTEIDGVALTAADIGKRILVKDESGAPERNGVYEIVGVDPALGLMNLVRASGFDEASEMRYGTSVVVNGGSQAGASFFLASRDIETVNGEDTDPLHWEQDVANANLGLIAGVPDLTISNDIDINDTNGSGLTTIGGSFTSGNSAFDGNITLQHQDGVGNVREVTLTSASNAVAAGGERGTIFNGVLSESTVGDRLHVRIGGGGTVTLTNGAHSYTGKTTLGAGSTLALHGAGSIGSSPWLEVESGARFDTSVVTGGDYTFEGTISGVGALQPGPPNALIVDGSGVIRPGLSSAAFNEATAGDQIGALTVNGDLVLSGHASGVDRLVLQMGADNGADFNDAGNFATHGGAGFDAWLMTQGNAYDTFKGGNHDRLTVTGDLSLDAGGRLVFEGGTSSYSPQYGDVFNLLDWTTLTENGFDSGGTLRDGGLWGDFALPSLTPNLLWNTSLFAGYGIVVVVPEPTRAMLMLTGVLAVVLRRRRRAASM